MNTSNLLALGFALALVVSGSGQQREFTISGGQKVTLPFLPQGAPAAESDDFVMVEAAFLAGPSKERKGGMDLTYVYSFDLKTNIHLSKVTVEDVSDSSAEVLLVDDSPKSVGNHWKGYAKPKNISADTIGWLYSPGDSIRIYRITIQTASGKTTTLLQPSLFLNQAKAGIRKMKQRD
jgi:hypothetical protein